MEKNQQKKRYGAGLLAGALIVGLCAGVCIGYMAGLRAGTGTGQHAASDLQSGLTVQTGETSDGGQTASNTQTGTEIEGTEETMGSFAVDDERVLTIDGTEIYLSEINARIYMARDAYVTQYGEEPWSMELDSGETVAEYAKKTLLSDMEREVILCGQAEAYGVAALTEEEAAVCSAQADDYMAALGRDVAAQFGVEREAVLTIYEREALSMKVYNQILEELTETLRGENAYEDMEDSDFEAVLRTQFDAVYEQWQDACSVETTDLWEQIVIGAVG